MAGRAGTWNKGRLFRVQTMCPRKGAPGAHRKNAAFQPVSGESPGFGSLYMFPTAQDRSEASRYLGYERELFGLQAGGCTGNVGTASINRRGRPAQALPGTGRSRSCAAAAASASSCAASMKPARKAISSGQATFRPCRFSSVAMNWPASSSAVVRAGVEPREAAAHDLDVELALVQVARG